MGSVFLWSLRTTQSHNQKQPHRRQIQYVIYSAGHKIQAVACLESCCLVWTHVKTDKSTSQSKSNPLEYNKQKLVFRGRPWFRRGLQSRRGHTGISDSRKTLNIYSRKRRYLRFSRLRLNAATIGLWVVWDFSPQRHLTRTGFRLGYLIWNKS